MALKLGDLMVLLCEPSITQSKIIKRQLQEMGIDNITICDSGHAALESMKLYPPDLAISSLYLPDMTGTDLIHRMREDPSLQESAFMLISSETQIQALESIRQAGAVAILPKPFDPADLLRALKATLDFLDPEDFSLENIETEELQVLLVDDSPLSRKHIIHTLRNLGFEHITEATDGAEAVELLNSHFFDLVVTDYHMPKMDGRQLVDHIRSGSQSTIPILMVTSETRESRLAAVQQAGVSAICDKPFEPVTIQRLLQQILEQQQDSHQTLM